MMIPPIKRDERYRDAVELVRKACHVLSDIGVETRVFGSLAKGDFRSDSDVDLLVMKCPRKLKYGIEGMVEDILGNIPFDLVYVDELPDWKKEIFIKGAKNVGELR